MRSVRSILQLCEASTKVPAGGTLSTEAGSVLACYTLT